MRSIISYGIASNWPNNDVGMQLSPFAARGTLAWRRIDAVGGREPLLGPDSGLVCECDDGPPHAVDAAVLGRELTATPLTQRLWSMVPVAF
jgi:hypothetical protein